MMQFHICAVTVSLLIFFLSVVHATKHVCPNDVLKDIGNTNNIMRAAYRAGNATAAAGAFAEDALLIQAGATPLKGRDYIEKAIADSISSISDVQFAVIDCDVIKSNATFTQVYETFNLVVSYKAGGSANLTGLGILTASPGEDLEYTAFGSATTSSSPSSGAPLQLLSPRQALPLTVPPLAASSLFDAINSTYQDIMKAYSSGSSAACADFYTHSTDAWLFTAGYPTAVEGTPAITSLYAYFISHFPVLLLDLQSAENDESDSMAWTINTFTSKAKGVSLGGIDLMVWKKEDGTWRVMRQITINEESGPTTARLA